MKRLFKYKTSKVNEVFIKYGNETINFNIFKEANINEEDIEREIKSQPSKYAFLFVLHKKLLTKFETLRQHRQELYGKLYAISKGKVSKSTGRPFSDDLSKAWVEAHPRYTKLTHQCIKAKDEADVLQGCVRAFEQRKDLIQTLSSNTRKERI